MFKFTPNELLRMAGNPDILRVLANEHDCRVVEGEAMGFDCKENIERAKELVKMAEKIEADI